MFADYHVHCEYSDDSVYPMETVVKDAIQKGINEICFTDHVDYGVRDDWDSGKPIIYRDGSAIVNVNYPLYVKQISELQKNIQKIFPLSSAWNSEFKLTLFHNMKLCLKNILLILLFFPFIRLRIKNFDGRISGRKNSAGI